MLMRAVEVEGLNCFGAGFRFDGLSDSVNILFGRNGSGKSSLCNGIGMAFLRPHRSSAEAVERFRPWNRRLHPGVKVEFDHAGHLYRISKRFLHKPEAKLERREGGCWNLFAQGDSAETFLQQMLKSAGGRGASSQDMSGFAQVLWSTQGHLELPALGEPVVAAIRSSVGAQMSAGSRDFELRITAAHAAVFTKTGRLREGQNGCEQVRLQAELAAAQAEAARLLAAVKGYEAAVARTSELQSEAVEAAACVQSLAAQLLAVEEHSRQYFKIASRVRELHAQQETAMVHWTAANDAIQVLQQKRVKASELVVEIGKLEQEQDTAAATLERTGAALQTAQGVLAEAEASQTAAQSEVARATLASEYLNAIRRKEEIDQKLGQLAQARVRIGVAQEELDGLLVPAQARVNELRSNLGDLAELNQRLDLARVRLAFTPERDCEIRVGDSQFNAVAGQAIELAGDPNLAFTVAGAGQFVISGPISDFESTQCKVEKYKTWISAFAGEFGTATVDEIVVRCERDKELKAAIKADNALISSLLGSDTELTLSAEALQLAMCVEQIEQSQPGWASERPDATKMSEAAKAQLAGTSEALDHARSREKNGQLAHYQAEIKCAQLRSKVDGLRNQVKEASQALAEAEREGKTDAARREELNIASAELIVARHEHENALQERAAIGADPTPEVARLKAEHTQAMQREHETLRQLNVLRGRLDQLCADSPYVQLNRAEEKCQELAGRLAAVTLKTDALALLKKSCDEMRAQTLASVSEPVEAAASKYLEMICGRPLARIHLNEDFASEGVVPSEHLEGNRVAADRMSAGEREQIHLCTRLALAAELAREEKQLVILDDVLTATDAQRMERVKEIIQDCGSRLQILILTCHPERFQSMRKARFFDLEALMGEAQREVA